jgi:putative addiction module CopG family antidote
MNVSLNPELERLVRERVERGDYESADALVQQAVQSLIGDDDYEDAQIADIRRRVQTAETEIDQGQVAEYDENTVGNLAQDVHRRGLERAGLAPRTTNRSG